MITHASIVPLIGGLPLAQKVAFKSKPKYAMSYDAFYNNDRHYVEYSKAPYHVLKLDEENKSPGTVDVVGATCPCAGLSSLSTNASPDKEVNDWMFHSTKFVLETVRPKVLWGENAPRLAGSMGKPIVAKLRELAAQNGYTMSIVKTMSKIHGLSQTRDRSFYFFWKGTQVPMFNFVQREQESIVDTILNTNLRDDDPMSNQLVNEEKPSQNPYYRYVLEELEGGITHQEFQEKIEKTWGLFSYIETKTTYDKVGKWMEEQGYDREVPKCYRKFEKLAQGKNIMRHSIHVPKTTIGAFVGSLPTTLIHPIEDRYLNIRECLTIMRMPDDFQLIGGKKNLNHICQNVPVSTAADWAEQIKLYLNGKLQMIDTEFMMFDNKSQKVEYEKPQIALTEFMKIA